MILVQRLVVLLGVPRLPNIRISQVSLEASNPRGQRCRDILRWFILRDVVQGSPELLLDEGEAVWQREEPPLTLARLALLPTQVAQLFEVQDSGVGRELDAGTQAGAAELIVAFRIQQLLEMPFRSAMRCCPALRRHVERQGDAEEVADEFEEYWRPDAPDALVSVLESLLLEEWQQKDAIDAGPLMHEEGGADPLDEFVTRARRLFDRSGALRGRAGGRLPRARL